MHLPFTTVLLSVQQSAAEVVAVPAGLQVPHLPFQKELLQQSEAPDAEEPSGLHDPQTPFHNDLVVQQ
jgi:hypothetical protein